VLNTDIGTDVALDDLEARFDAVFLSLGTWKETSVRITGQELGGVLGALHFLEAEARGQKFDLGERVVIIGGGNAAIDCARTVIRRGASATVIYRRERKDMPAIQEEVEAAEEEGVRFVFLASPYRIVGERSMVKAIEVSKTRLGAFDPSGRRRPIDTGEILTVSCNTVILAVGESIDVGFCKTTGLDIAKGGWLEVDRYDLTASRDGVFAGGDFVTGASNLTTAMGWGKDAARNIDRYLSSEPSYERIMPRFQYDQAAPKPSPCHRHHAHFLPAAMRAGTFAEAVTALPPEEAREEAARCLRCDIRETTAFSRR
jgi:NADH-quinone oxidoreductase subunit F